MTFNAHFVGDRRRTQLIFFSTAAELHRYGGKLCLGWTCLVCSLSTQGKISPNIWLIGWMEFGVIDGGYGGWLLLGTCGSWGTRSYFQMTPLMETNCWRMLYSYCGHGLEVLRKISQFTIINGPLTLEMLLFLVEGRIYSVAVAVFIYLPVWFPPRLLCSLSWEPFHWILL